MRRALCSLPVVLLSATIAACGGAGKGGRPVSAASSGTAVRDAAAPSASNARESLAAPIGGDGDGDSSERTAFDGDDYHSMHFGHAADAADRRSITAVVRRYYAALAREDGATVCSLLLEVVAESLPEPGNGQTPARSPDVAGTTCAAAVAGQLAESHRALLDENRTLRVIGVRVRRRRASALLRFGGRAARHILLYKEGGAWKIGTLADEDLG